MQIWDQLQAAASADPKPDHLEIGEADVSSLAAEMEAQGRFKNFSPGAAETFIRGGSVTIRDIPLRVRKDD